MSGRFLRSVPLRLSRRRAAFRRLSLSPAPRGGSAQRSGAARSRCTAAAAARSVPAPLAAAGSAAAASSGVPASPGLGMLITPRDEALTASFLHDGWRRGILAPVATFFFAGGSILGRSGARFWAPKLLDSDRGYGVCKWNRPKAPHTLTNRPASLAKATGPKITLDAYCRDELG